MFVVEEGIVGIRDCSSRESRFEVEFLSRLRGIFGGSTTLRARSSHIPNARWTAPSFGTASDSTRLAAVSSSWASACSVACEGEGFFVLGGDVGLDLDSERIEWLVRGVTTGCVLNKEMVL